MRPWRSLRLAFWLALGAASVAPAQSLPANPSDPALEAELRAVRARLQRQEPNLAAEELERRAAILARSNHLGRLVVQALERSDYTGALRLLEEFPGHPDDLRVFGWTLPVFAIERNQPALLEALLRRGANPNLPAPDGQPPLHFAIKRRLWDSALALLRAGASANAADSRGRTPLGVLSDGGWLVTQDPQRLQMLTTLLEHGADPFRALSTNATAVSLVESLGSRNRFQSLGGTVDLLLTNAPAALRFTPRGQTALHLAALWARTNALDFLLDAGWNINQTNLDGLTPLQTLVGAFAAPSPSIPSPIAIRGFAMAPNWSFPSSVMDPRGPRRPPLPGISPGTAALPAAAPPARPRLPVPPLADRLLERGASLDIFTAAGLSRWPELEAMLRENPALANAQDGLGRTPLHYAVWAGRIAATRRLLNAGADPNAAMTKPLNLSGDEILPAGSTPLHLAAHIHSEPLLRMLLAAGADPSRPDANGDTPLHVAASLPDSACPALLVAARAPLDRTNRAGLTPLRAAVLSGATETVTLLLRAGAKPDIGPEGKSLLHEAAECNRTDALRILLRRGLPLDAPDAFGNTPFRRAVGSRQFQALAWLYQKGANVNAADTNGDTALHFLLTQADDRTQYLLQPSFWETWKQNRLARPGLLASALQRLIQAKLLAPPRGRVVTNISLTAWLLDHGANPNATNRAGKTPLHMTPFQPVWYPGNPLTNQIACLLRAGARVDVPDAEGETPLHRAARLASPEIFALLLQAADRAKRGTPLARALDAPDAAGRTPLFCAAESDRFALTNLALLLARGADPNVCTTGGVSLLHHVAAGPVRWPVPDAPLRVKLLLQRGANPNHPDAAGRTPLHALAAGEHPFTLTNAALLLAHGADPNARDRHGFTPLHFALTNRHWNVRRADLVNLLLQHRADPNATNASGQTPLILLAHAFLNRDFFQGAPEAARALLDAGADPAARDTNGQTFLHQLTEGAGGWGNIREIVADLLARHPDLAGLTNAAGDTLLHAAIRANNHMFVQLLLERGADVTRRNAAGESPLLLAARDWPRGYAWQVRPPGTTDTFWNTLLRRDFPQFEIWLRAEPRLAEVPFRDGQLPLAFAFKQRLTNFVNLLLELRAPLDPVSALYLGRTNELRAMLHQSNRIAPELLADAIRAGQFDAIQDLAAERGALQPANPCDQSLLRVALEHGRAATADWLRARGVALTLHDAVELGDTNALRRSLLTNREALNQPCPHGRTLLGDAVRAKRAESAGALLALGADPNARENRGYTPLHLAAMWNAREIAQRLLEAGADVDARDEHSLTPLHHAARAGNTELAALLLQHGANVNTPTTRPPDDMVTMPAGATPLHWAAHAGRLDVVRLLLRHGANPALTNALGQTPLALVRTNAAAPKYRYGWVTFREPPPADPARAQIARLLSR